MAQVLVANNAVSTLASGINDSVTSLTVSSGEGALFPAISAGDWFYVTLVDTSNNKEIVKVTARSTDTFTVVRGSDNTTAAAFSASDLVELRPTAAMFEDIRDTEANPIDDSVDTAAILDGAVTYPKMATAAIADAAAIHGGDASKIVDAEGIKDAAAPVALTDAATIAIDWSAGINFTVTLTASRTVGFPTVIQPGTWRRVEVTQDGTGGWTLTWTATGFLSASGDAPEGSIGANDVDVYYLYGRSSSLVEVYSGAVDLVQIT